MVKLIRRVLQSNDCVDGEHSKHCLCKHTSRQAQSFKLLGGGNNSDLPDRRMGLCSVNVCGTTPLLCDDNTLNASCVIIIATQ